MEIRHRLPDWETGFTANLAAELLNGLATAYLPFYLENPLPPLYSGHVVYRLEPNHGSGFEEFANPWEVAERGWGDCDDLVLYRLVELRAAGEEKAHTRAEWVRPNVHVLIRRAPGKLPQTEDKEDPSLILLALEAQQQ